MNGPQPFLKNTNLMTKDPCACFITMPPILVPDGKGFMNFKGGGKSSTY